MQNLRERNIGENVLVRPKTQELGLQIVRIEGGLNWFRIMSIGGLLC
jgi:hypothetical protein